MASDHGILVPIDGYDEHGPTPVRIPDDRGVALQVGKLRGTVPHHDAGQGRDTARDLRSVLLAAQGLERQLGALTSQQLATAERARRVTAELYVAYSQEPVLMDEQWVDGLPRHEPDRSRHIVDYIAGMTDRFAIARHAEIYGRTPEGLRNV